MPLTITQSRGGRDVVFLVDTANASIAPGNASINTTAGEIITGLVIRKIVAGVGVGGMVTVQRDANVVYQTAVSQSIDFGSMGMPISVSPTANVVVNFVGANCTAQIECSKRATIAGTTY